MTNEEAVNVIEKYIRCGNEPCNDVRLCSECDLNTNESERDEAFKIAIEALRDSPTQTPRTSGLISRDEAIDDLHGKDPSRIWDTADIEVWVNGLPSAQPEPSIRIITAHLKQRLWETALNNVARKGTLGDAYADVARHRLDAWMDEITGMEDKTGTKWIPCSERMPVLDEAVLATTAWNDITIAWREGIDEWRIHEGNTNAETDDLIAWLPLPDPYKPQQEDNT